MKKPSATVAVITRTKDRPLFLPRALQSIRRQTFRDFIWVIVNDAGDPAPIRELVKQAQACGINVLHIDKKKSTGMEAASNLGCRAVQSKYIAIHDDDDTWEPDFLKDTVAFLERESHYAGVVTRVDMVTERRVRNKWKEIERSVFMAWSHAIYIVDMMQQNLFPPIAFLFRRSIYNKVGGFNEEMMVLGDWEFALRILVHEDIARIKTHLANYYIREANAATNDPYRNSITGWSDTFTDQDARIRNKLLRDDLAKGTFGLGMMVNFGRQHNAMWNSLILCRDMLNVQQEEQRQKVKKLRARQNKP